MKSYFTRIIFEDKEHEQARIRVQSNMTFYEVAINRHGAVAVFAPGMEEYFDREEEKWEELSFEALALIAVIRLEDR